MGDSQFTKVLDSRDQLLEETARLILLEPVLRGDVLEQFPVAAVLHYQEDPVRRLDYFVHLDDVRVPHDLQDVDLTRHSLDVVDVFDLPLVQDLDGHFLPRVDVHSLAHFSECPLSDDALGYLIVADHLGPVGSVHVLVELLLVLVVLVLHPVLIPRLF